MKYDKLIYLPILFLYLKKFWLYFPSQFTLMWYIFIYFNRDTFFFQKSIVFILFSCWSQFFLADKETHFELQSTYLCKSEIPKEASEQ